MTKTNYDTYSLHYKRMLNVIPSVQLSDYNYENYIFARPWIQSIAKDMPILDIGCGFGVQLFLFKQLGFTNLHGIEITRESLDVAYEELSSDVSLELIDAFNYLPQHKNKFAAITCNDVLEHIPREKTIEFLTLVNEALLPGGVVSLRVPNMSSLLSSYSMCLDFTHLVGFTEFSLMQVLDLAGFENHNIVRQVHSIKWGSWRPWKPLHGLGLSSIANDIVHRALYKMRGQTPIPKEFGYNLEMWSYKRC